MVHKRVLELLDEFGVEGAYFDEDGDLVIQYDPNKIDLEEAESLADGAKYESVEGGFTARIRRTDRWRPVPTGVSHGALDVTAGSTGVLVQKDGVGPLVDTNYHVAVGPTLKEDEPIIQPGDADDGSLEEDHYGNLYWYLEMGEDLNRLSVLFDWMLNFRRKGNEKPRYNISKSKVMRHDVALVQPLLDDDMKVEEKIVGTGGYPDTIQSAPVGEICEKSGRTTKITTMRKASEEWSGNIMYPWGPVRFVDQHLFKEHDGKTSRGGDSGSTICWDDFSRVDARLFAGNSKEELTIGNPYEHFSNEYNVALW